MTVYDYSFARPDPQLLGNGVIRYLAPSSNGSKVLGADELSALHGAGKPVGCVWEATADPSTWDGAAARAEHQALGFPASRPIYFAADRAIGPDEYEAVGQLLDATVVPVEVRGIYGGAPLVQWCIDNGHAGWGWIASALSWSMSPPYSVDRAIALAPSAQLIQLVGTDVPGTDMNRVLKDDWGGWHPDITPPAPPTPAPEDDEVNLANCIIAIELAYAAHGAGGDDAGKAYWQEQVAAAQPDGRDAVLALMVSKLKK